MGYGKFQESKYPWLLPVIERMKDMLVGDNFIVKIPDETVRTKSKHQLHTYLYRSGGTGYYHLKTISDGIYVERRTTNPHVEIIEQETLPKEDRFPRLEDPIMEEIFLGTFDTQGGGDPEKDKEKLLVYLRGQVEEHNLTEEQIQTLSERIEDFYKVKLL
jgi:hypothetical protein